MHLPRLNPALALLPVTLLPGCGGAPEGPGAGARETVLLTEGCPAHAQRALWVDDRAWLQVTAEGTGRVSVAATLEGQEPVALLEREVDGSATETVELPGEGARPIQLDFVATGEARWTGARAGQPDVPPLPPAERLAGSLAGRDVLVLVPDSVHAAHASSYGHTRPTTPNLDRLAQRGVRFANAYSQTAWTLSSVTSLFTSLEQERHGVLRMDQSLSDEASTLAELFRQAHYRTVGLVQNGVIGKQTGLDQGFQVYRTFPWGPQGLQRLMEWARGEITAERDGPLFLYVHLTPPHMPYQPPRRYRNRFANPDYEGEVDGSILSCAVIRRDGLPADHADVRHLAALYDEHLSYADAEAGGLMDALETRPGPGCVILATSDHGEAFMQHGTQGHNSHVYEEMVRVPLVVSAPGSALPSGVSIDTPVSLLDVLPTLVDLCGLEPPEHAPRGTSLAGLMEGREGLRPRPLFLSSRYLGDPTRLHFGVRIGPHKLVMKAGESVLYDLERDPGEMVDRSAEAPVTAAALQGELSRWRLAANAERMEAGEVVISEERRAEIEALGYGGDDDDE